MNENSNNEKKDYVSKKVVTVGGKGGKKKYVHYKKKKQKRERTPEEKKAYWEKVRAIQEERRKKKKERREREKLEPPKEKKPAIMKYNIEAIDDQDPYDESNYLHMCFGDRAREELEKFEYACNKAYQRFYLHHTNKKAELEYHQEVKKYRKVFNHNIQEITKQDKFRIIRELNGKITEYQTN